MPTRAAVTGLDEDEVEEAAEHGFAMGHQENHLEAVDDIRHVLGNLGAAR